MVTPTLRRFLLPLISLLGWLAGSALAGTWSIKPWTNDASMGLSTTETLWAYHFGSATTATVSGVSVPGLAGPPPVSELGKVVVSGVQFVLNPDFNNLTSQSGTGSATIGSSFFYGGFPATVTVKAASLQPGVRYIVSLFSVGWDGAPDQRLIKFVSDTDEMPIDQNLYGENNGLRADYDFTANGADQVINVQMDNGTNRTFHLYAVALSKPLFNTTTVLSSSANPSQNGQSITFTATVTSGPGGGTPTGSVTFMDGAATLGTGTLNGSGVATFTTSALSGGIHSITASYAATANWQASTSPPLSQGVGFVTVTSAATSGPGSLTQNITDAPPGATLIFQGSLAGAVIPMPAAEIILDKDLTIDASALAGGITLRGGGTNRLFYIQAGRSVVFKNLTLTGGGGVGAANTLRGGAVLNAGTLLAEDCVFTGNKASLGGGLASGYSTANTSATLRRCVVSWNTGSSQGGGVVNLPLTDGLTATLRLEECALHDNSTPNRGGALYNFASEGTADVFCRQCTFARNDAGAEGGGIINFAAEAGDTAHLSLLHCTLTENVGKTGGGLNVLISSGGAGSLSLTSTLIAGNRAQISQDVVQNGGTFTSGGGNLIGTTSLSRLSAWITTDLTGTDALPVSAGLAPLGCYGGPTPSCPPLPGSLALDRVPDLELGTDQRGHPRVTDGNGDSTAMADIGAVEAVFVQVDVAGDELDTPAGTGDVSLREALRDAPPGALIIVPAGLSTQTLTLSEPLGSLAVTKDVAVIALSRFTLRRESPTVRLFTVSTGVSLHLGNLNLTGLPTAVFSQSGAVIHSQGGTVSLDSCSLSGHRSGALGGAVFSSGGRLHASRCTFTSNTASQVGGAIYSSNGGLTLRDSTLTANGQSISGGGLYLSGGHARLSQCTLDGNTSTTDGGGIVLSGSASLEMNHCTISRNQSAEGGGISQSGSSSFLSLSNTLLAGNTAVVGSPDLLKTGGTLLRSGGNLVSKNDSVATEFPAGAPNANGDYVGTSAAPVDALLGLLADNGGPTQSCLPLAGSPALDHAGTTTPPRSDQRGQKRVRDGDGNNTFVADIGSVEAGTDPVLVVNTLVDELDTPAGASLSLREAVRDAPPDAHITFAPTLNGQTLVLDSTKNYILLNRNVTLDASSLSSGVTVDGGTGDNKIFIIGTGATIQINQVNLTGGGGEGGGNPGMGGAIENFAGTLILSDCRVYGNSALLRGGAIMNTSQGNRLVLLRCTLDGNRVTSTTPTGFIEGGGAINTTNNQTLDMEDCSVFNNESSFYGGALISSGSDAAFLRCTFHHNQAADDGGAVMTANGGKTWLDHCTLTRNHAGGGDGGAIFTQFGTDLTLTHCTIAGNTSSSATPNGGIAIVGQAGDKLTLNFTILAGNLGQDLRLYNAAPTPTSGGGNVMGLDGFFSNYSAPGDVRNITAAQLGLAELGRYGGLTDTMPPLPGSPAMDAAVNSTATTDQRGFPRSKDGNFDSIGVTDSGAAESEVVQVTTSSDQNDTPAGANLSLREAVRDAPVGAVISTTLNSWSVSSGDIAISRPLIVAASTPANIVSVTGSQWRAFHVLPGVRAHLHRIVISNLRGGGATLSGKGGAILNQGDLSMTSCNLNGNLAEYGGAIANGMAATPCRLRLFRSGFNANAASIQGGVIYNASAAGGSAVVEMESCHLFKNNATRNGGATANLGGNGSASLTAEHCTIMENSAQSTGGGVFTSLPGAATQLTSCLIAENTALTSGPDVQTSGGNLTSGGTNLIRITDGSGITWLTSDLTGTAAAPLAARTHSEIDSYIPRPDSPAIDAAAVTTRILLDRSGNPRVSDGDASGTAQPDIGAFEVSSIRVTTAADELDTPSGANVSLREAIRDAGASPINTVLRLDPSLSGQTLTLSAGLGEITVNKPIYLDASGLPGGFTIDGGPGTNRIFNNSSFTLQLRGLTLTGGAAAGDGGAILSSGTLILEDCVLRGNTATGSGGAISKPNGFMVLKRCTLTQNTATSSGGALNSNSVSLTLIEDSAFTANEAGGRGGAIFMAASNYTVTNRIHQCTVEGNRSGLRGGGIYLEDVMMGISQCTVVRNEALTERGGGLVLHPRGLRMPLQNTLVADNRAPVNSDLSLDSSSDSIWPMTYGGNLIGTNTGGSAAFPAGLPNASGDYVGTDTVPLKALVAPSGIYGGTTPTCPPMPGSPALDRAITPANAALAGSSTASLPTGDQRGFTRSVDGDFNGTARPDIGAAESVIVRVDVAADELDVPAGTNEVSLREALRDAPEGAVIGFVPALSGVPLIMNSELVPERSVVISSAGLTQRVILTALTGNRILRLDPGLSLGLSHLFLNQAGLETSPGGAIYNEGSLALADCTLSGNSSTPSGGAIYSAGASTNPRNVSVRLVRCGLMNNATLGSGGAIYCLNSRADTVHQATFEDCEFFTNTSRDSPSGAIANVAAAGQSLMTLRRCTLSHNEAANGWGGGLVNWGAGAAGRAVALLEACTLTQNEAKYGGGVASLAAFGGTATTTLRQCTLAYNNATVRGDDVLNETSHSGSTSTLSLIQCTVIGNPSGPGTGGVVGYAASSGNTNTTTLDRCIIARHNAHDVRVQPDPGSPASTTITSLGTNLIGKTDGSGVTWQPGDLTGTNAAPLDPMVADLGEYGGPTETMPPLPGSPARDPASGATLATGQADQRGFARLVGTKVDIGAVEAGAADAPGSIAFGGPLIRVNESATPVQIPIYRTAGSIGTVTVRVNSTPSTATSPADFTAVVNQTLTFEPGETVKNLPVTLVADPKVNEPHETFTLTLSNITGGATLGAQSTTTVRILDFVEPGTPSLTLSGPTANSVVLGASVTVIGTAKDDKGLQAVQVQLNGGSFVDATLTGTPQLSNFSLGITAVPGVNSLVVRAVDEKGKISALTKRSFTYKLPSTLTVNISGPANCGTVSAGFTPTSTRDVGMTYKITATAKPGFIFTGWNASSYPFIGIPPNANPTTVSFVMKPGLTITAFFLSLANVSTYAGTYQGVLTPFYEPVVSDNSSVGFISISVTSTGAVTGKVLIDGASLPFAGQVIGGKVFFNPARSYELGFVRKGKSTINLSVSMSGGSNSSAQVFLSDNRLGYTDNFSYVLNAYRSPYSSKNKVPTSLVTGTSQRYNLIFPSVPDQPGVSSYPPGTGIGSLILGSDGSVKIAGTLADNTPFTASTALTSQHTVPLFASLYANQGHIAGNINIVGPTGPGYDAFGLSFYWCRPAQPKAQWYPLGWPKNFFIDLVGAKYLLPPTSANQSCIPGLGPVDLTNTVGNATLTFMDGLLSSTRNYAVNITTKDAVTPLPLKTKNFTLTLTKATGEIKGTFTHTDGKKPAFKGTTIQKPGDYQGTFGFFMSVPPNKTSTNGQSGSVMLLPGALPNPP